MLVTCRSCNTPVDIPVTDEQLANWQNGAYIQHAMANIPAELREMFLSGLCPACFDRMFREDR